MQGAPLIASILETEILPARVEGYQPSDLDALTTAGEVVWGGLEPLGEHDGRLALYLTDHVGKAAPEPRRADCELPGRERAIVEHLEQHGASFFAAMHEAAGGGYPGETVDAIWSLVWAGAITNDSLHAVRAFTRPADRRSRKAEQRSRARRPPDVPQPPDGAADRRGPLVADGGAWPGRRCPRRSPRPRSRSSSSPATAC